MKTDDLGWAVGSHPSHGICCPKQKVGEKGVLEAPQMLKITI